MLFLPADVDGVREDPGPSDSIAHRQGDGQGEQQVRQGKAEDEDVPCCSHFSVTQSGYHDTQIARN